MPDDFWKRSEDLIRLETLLDGQEATIRKAVLDFTNRVSSDEVIKALADLIAKGQTTEAMGVIEYEGATLGTASNAVFLGSAQKEADAIVAQLREIAPKAPLVFNGFDPKFTSLANQTGIQFIQNTTRTQQESVLAAVQGHIGQDTRSLSRVIRQSIGLTEKQNAAVQSYRNLLESGSRQAFDRALRDKRFDAADLTNRTQPQIDRMVDRYRENYVKHRADVIARTEGGNIMGLAREAGFRQMIGRAGIPNAQATKSWKTRADSRVRDTHDQMEGQTVALDDLFVTPTGWTCQRPLDPSLPASERCQCRCISLFRLLA